MAAMSALLTIAAIAGEKPTNEKKVTPQGKYLSPKEAYEMKQANPDSVLFIDVRTPEELYFVGYPSNIDRNIPIMYVNYGKLKELKNGKVKYATRKNENFVSDIEKALSQKKMGKDSAIILICRSGHRSAKAARILDKAGYKNVYSVDEGVEGDKDKKKHRSVNGWKNAGMPYTYTLKKDILAPSR
jgi:rhodanese-related sulfurtransferase